MERPVFFVVVAFLFLGIHSVNSEKYSDKYDHMDVEGTLANDVKRNEYYYCFIGSGPCVTDDAQFFKDNMPEAVATKCEKCTEWQVTAFDKIAAWYTEHDEAAWNALIAKMLEEAKAKNIPGA